MYTFEDKGNESMTLRPEGTASVCRAYLEHGMHNLPQPVRLYYFCPIFRYERPQAGRFRQHHQFGLEALGDSDPAIDAEIIQLAWLFTKRLGLNDVSLLINSIGDQECRPAYIEELQSYYLSNRKKLCANCEIRLQNNPLRLLDCKVDKCQNLAIGAPHSIEFLCKDCLDHWGNVTNYLTSLSIPFKIETSLVRGFDYYTRTVFEIEPKTTNGQSTIIGGGRYDGLIQQLGGKSVPGMGFASGIERLILNLDKQNVVVDQNKNTFAVVMNSHDNFRNNAVLLASRLHEKGVTCVIAPAQRSLKGQMRYATSIGATHALILGEDEVRENKVAVKDLDTGNQYLEGLDEVIIRLAN